jgi:hypothetical protein
MEYIAIHKKDKVIGVIDLDEVTIGFLDRMFHEGYEFSKISKKDLVE